MNAIDRLALFVIRLATPPSAREWVVGDTVEEFNRVSRARGHGAAQQWLRREMVRVLRHAPRHRFAARAGRADQMGRVGPSWSEALASLPQDIRYAWRGLRRSPGFAAVAIATLAVGIGANTAMFAVVNAVLLKPLPFRDADRLMLVHLQVPPRDGGPGVYRDSVWSYPKYRALVDLNQVFEETALFSVGDDFTIARDGSPERVRGETITDRYFSVLGITPVVGRAFTHDETQRAGAPALVLLGHGLWVRRYGSEPGIIGRTIHIDSTPHEVIGVLPRGFTGLNGVAEVWLPLARDASQLTQAQSHSYRLIARRHATVSDEGTEEAVRRYGGEISKMYDGPGRAWSARAVSLSASRADLDVRLASLILLGGVAFVLLIGCVNLTNLLAAKAIAHQREVAIRVAIGASRARILRQFIVDSGVLATLGALGGLAFAIVLLRAASVLLPDSDVFFRTSVAPGLPRIEGASGLTRIGARMIGFDAMTLAFMAGVTILTAILVALVPALRASSLHPVSALKTGGADAARGGHRFGGRSALVAVQIALALILLTGAGLMVKSAARLHDIRAGINTDNVLTARIALPRQGYPLEKGFAFFDALQERVQAMHGVDAVAFANAAPLMGAINSTGLGLGPTFDVSAGKAGRLPLIDVVWASPDYFRTLGVELKRGRLFTAYDRVGLPKVVLINEAAARQFWPNADPASRRVTLGMGGFHDGAEVIGIVSDVRQRTLESAPIPIAYIPLLQSYQPTQQIFIRSSLDTRTLI